MLRIVCGIDGSQPAAAALEVATRLFPTAQATLAHFWRSPIGEPEVRGRLLARAGDMDELIELAEHEGAERAERLVAEAAANARAAGWEVEPLARRVQGEPGFELARAAEKLDADLIVVGARGLGGVKAVLGSTSDLTVHVSAVPVLVVPQRSQGEDVAAGTSGPVLVGYDGSDGSRRALSAAASILGDREFVVATVRDANADVVQRDALALDGIGDAEVVVLERSRGGPRSTATALFDCADEHNASVVVVGSRGRSAAGKILLGSVAMGVLHEARTPTLVVPGRRSD